VKNVPLENAQICFGDESVMKNPIQRKNYGKYSGPFTATAFRRDLRTPHHFIDQRPIPEL
jgi:hypothetical protein